MTRYAWSKVESRWVKLTPAGPRRLPEIVNRDAPFADGIASPANGRRYRSRRDWDEHLRANGMVEIGNDVVGPPASPEGG